MSKYTTGELAKLCGVTVRTVQYYDTRNILTPSALSEGGRRLYSEEDVKRMKTICFLRDLGLPINTISDLLSEKEPGKVIDLLLDQQSALLREELAERQTRLDKLNDLRRELKNVERFSVESIGDIAHVMENKKKLRKVHGVMLGVGVPLELIEWGALAYAITTGNWWLFAVSLCLVILGAAWLVRYYYKNVMYICPQCHTVFRPGFWQMFFANHTPKTRKLTCTSCGHRGYCVETCAEEEEK